MRPAKKSKKSASRQASLNTVLAAVEERTGSGAMDASVGCAPTTVEDCLKASSFGVIRKVCFRINIGKDMMPRRQSASCDFTCCSTSRGHIEHFCCKLFKISLRLCAVHTATLRPISNIDTLLFHI